MEIDETRYGYVYRITNLINGKTYIGQHKIIKDEKWLTYMGSGRLIHLALRKYDKVNFFKELLCYADSVNELNNVEKKFINDELLIGKSEYNILGCENSLKVRLKDLDFTDKDLLKWYFDENMSYRDIALKLRCSVSVIHNYMSEFKNTDMRFKDIKPGDNRGKASFSEEALKKSYAINQQKIKCKNCSKEIVYLNYSRHIEACIDGYSRNSSKCLYSACDTIVKIKGTHCRKHINISSNFGDSAKFGGIVASHNRWHVKRNKVSESCILCNNT